MSETRDEIIKRLGLNPTHPMDGELIKLIDECPRLTDEGFLRTYPGVFGIVSLMHDSHQFSLKNYGRSLGAYTSLGVNTTREFVDLLLAEDERALAKYKSLQDTLGFSV